MVDVSTDCDSDALLVLADPHRAHLPQGHGLLLRRCDAAADAQRLAFLALLENIIANRIADQPEGSYTARLFAEGPGRIAQKVGEEGVETALAAVSRDDDGLVSECADLVFHLLVLLKSRDLLARARGRGTQGAPRLEGADLAQPLRHASRELRPAPERRVGCRPGPPRRRRPSPNRASATALPKSTAPGRTSKPLVR